MTTPLATPPPLATDTVPPVALAESPWRGHPSCLVTDAPVVSTVLPAAPSGSLLVQAPLDESPPLPPSGSRPDTPSPEPPPDAVRESSDAANADEPLPLAAYPLERCAAIAASIARNKADKLAILERNELIQAVWAELDRHWQDVVTNENKRGKHRLQDAYDAAWVTQLEDERGALTIVEYAKLLVGTERGSEDTVLAELGVPRAAMAHLRRFWLKKTSKNVAIARALREAVERAREE